MTNWTDLVILKDNLITYYFGSPLVFYLGVAFLVLLILLMAGMDLRFALLFSLPIVAAMSLQGLFGAYNWIVSVILVLVAIVYAYALIKLFT